MADCIEYCPDSGLAMGEVWAISGAGHVMSKTITCSPKRLPHAATEYASQTRNTLSAEPHLSRLF